MEEINMTLSGVFPKDGKKAVRASFLDGKRLAEFRLPGAVPEKNDGFSEEEIQAMQEYLLQNQAGLYERAKKINPIKNMLGMQDV